MGFGARCWSCRLPLPLPLPTNSLPPHLTWHQQASYDVIPGARQPAAPADAGLAAHAVAQAAAGAEAMSRWLASPGDSLVAF